MAEAANDVAIEYDENIQKQLINSVLESVVLLYRRLAPKHTSTLQTFLIAKLCQLFRATSGELVMRYKSKHWKSEQEWRLIVALFRNERRGTVRFRSGHFGLIPYVELAPLERAGVFAGRLPITQVVLGPHPEQALHAEAMRDYLTSHDYWHTDVRISDVPLRF